jgi:hypothetical protein
VTRFIQLSLLLALTFLFVLAAFLLRYEPIPDPGVNLASTILHRVVWDRWTQRLCVAFIGRAELACTADDLKIASPPSVVGIDEVKARLVKQIAPMGYIEKITRTE